MKLCVEIETGDDTPTEAAGEMLMLGSLRAFSELIANGIPRVNDAFILEGDIVTKEAVIGYSVTFFRPE